MIQRELETELSRMLLRGELREGEKVVVGLKEERLTFEVEGRPPAAEQPSPPAH